MLRYGSQYHSHKVHTSIITSSSSATAGPTLNLSSLLRLLPQKVVMLISSERARGWIQEALTVQALEEEEIRR